MSGLILATIRQYLIENSVWMKPIKWLGIELVEVSLLEKLVSAIGSTCAIFAVIWVTHLCLPGAASACVIASMGASAVLLYAVPHGQLSQPWPLVGGHTISAIIGVTCARYVPDTTLATALAVGLSIGAMHQLKCIHPPGGATAFTAVMGGADIHQLGYSYLWCPVLFNVAIMLGLAVLFNLPFAWRRYPAVWARHGKDFQQGSDEVSPETHARVLEAVRSLDSFVDVTEEDLVHLTKIIARHSSKRAEKVERLKRGSLDAATDKFSDRSGCAV